MGGHCSGNCTTCPSGCAFMRGKQRGGQHDSSQEYSKIKRESHSANDVDTQVKRAFRRANSIPLAREDDVVYTYDGSLEGFFSAVFTSYQRGEHPANIATLDNLQFDLFRPTVSIPSDDALAWRVREGICNKLGTDEYERIRTAFLSDDPARGGVIFRYIHYAMAFGKYAHCNLTRKDVAEFEDVWKDVYTERHRILQFLRFSRMQNGVFFAKINPKAKVVPLIMEHFSQRFNTQPFLIYDEVHRIAGAYDTLEWKLVQADDFTIPPYAPEEAAYQDLWKTFYDAICNDERYNPRLRMQFMPKRLWANICEMNPLTKLDTQREFSVEGTIASAAGSYLQQGIHKTSQTT